MTLVIYQRNGLNLSLNIHNKLLYIDIIYDQVIILAVEGRVNEPPTARVKNYKVQKSYC